MPFWAGIDDSPTKCNSYRDGCHGTFVPSLDDCGRSSGSGFRTADAPLLRSTSPSPGRHESGTRPAAMTIPGTPSGCAADPSGGAAGRPRSDAVGGDQQVVE